MLDSKNSEYINFDEPWPSNVVITARIFEDSTVIITAHNIYGSIWKYYELADEKNPQCITKRGISNESIYHIFECAVRRRSGYIMEIATDRAINISIRNKHVGSFYRAVALEPEEISQTMLVRNLKKNIHRLSQNNIILNRNNGCLIALALVLCFIIGILGIIVLMGSDLI